MDNMRRFPLIVIGLLALLLFHPAGGGAEPGPALKDAAGRMIHLDRPPARVVSIVPSVTEILFRIGAGDAVAGVTYHDVYPPAAAEKPVVGGFFAPSLERIDALQPDVLFVADLHASVIAAYAGRDRPQLIELPLNSFEELFEAIRLLGRLFWQEAAAAALIREIEADLSHTRQKTAAIPATGRRRVLRLMGRDQVMTPGADSFQNEMIRRAGGIPPDFGQTGSVVPVSLAQWQAFNPQVVYGCGGDRQAAAKLFDRPGWREVDAVKNGRLIYFPCDLTCRMATRSGYFVSCLAARIYADEYAELPPVRPDGRIGSRSLALPLPYVEKAEIVESSVNDFIHKTLLVHLSEPMAVASTLEGFREKIRHVGNSYSPPQVWGLYHRIGLEQSRKQLLNAVGCRAADTSLLFTGADMDNLSVQEQQFKAMRVFALVTAGVRSNAVRMAEDIGAYYEPGTINMLILTNMRLTPRAMNRAVISATEAKTAALQDLDIRSSYTGLTNPATGTGTDNIIVVQGTGPRIDNAGGHTKMGELIARAAYAGVREAVFKQNGIVARRHLVHRLDDRRISLFGLVGDCACGMAADTLTRELESLLMDPVYAGFMESALALSDAQQRGLIEDLDAFERWCEQTAAAVAGRPVVVRHDFTYAHSLPPVVKLAVDALLSGVSQRAGNRGTAD
jgi:ABC-type Fe3+-hydroxamate transport system substrate-binding protein/adenosylcobinamide amidohydrolase